MVGQAQYVEGVLQSVVGVDRVCIGGSGLQGWTGINPGCSKITQHGEDSAGEARKDRIKRGRDHNEREKRERAPRHTCGEAVEVLSARAL